MNISINVKLKTLFDKLYLSRNKFEDLLDKLKLIVTGESSESSIINRALEIINSINTIVNALNSLQEYNEKIDELNAVKNNYVQNSDIIISNLIDHYDNIVSRLLVEIEAQRIITTNSDIVYKQTLVAGDVKPYNEFIETPVQNLSSFIPTDDYFSWNTLKRKKEVFTDVISLVSEDFEKIDPLDDSTIYTGDDKSKNLSHSPVIFDVVINTKNGGFIFSSINSRTGEVYTRIEDGSDAELFINDNLDVLVEDSIINNTTSPKPSLKLSIKESRPVEISIRRHGESSVTPTRIYSSLNK